MSVNKHVVVVANGDLNPAERMLPIIDTADTLIAADGGANALVQMGRYPKIIVGDMDSVAPALLSELERRGCLVRRYPTHKDETDTELALIEAVRLGARRITLLGALGGRVDHALANLLLLSLPELAGCQVAIYDGDSFISLVRGRVEVEGHPGDLLSLIPLAGDALGIRTSGLEYPLRGEPLRFGPARGISNMLLAHTAEVSLESGMLLMVHTPQEPGDAT